VGERRPLVDECRFPADERRPSAGERGFPVDERRASVSESDVYLAHRDVPFTKSRFPLTDSVDA
jgi:hypothetical protein